MYATNLNAAILIENLHFSSQIYSKIYSVTMLLRMMIKWTNTSKIRIKLNVPILNFMKPTQAQTYEHDWKKGHFSNGDHKEFMCKNRNSGNIWEKIAAISVRTHLALNQRRPKHFCRAMNFSIWTQSLLKKHSLFLLTANCPVCFIRKTHLKFQGW